MRVRSGILFLSFVWSVFAAEPVADPSWFRAFAKQKASFFQKKPEVLFVGDSLTDYWSSTGKSNWELDFHDLKAGNYGIAGDRVEHMDYRLQKTDFKRHEPRVFVILAGTNNLSQEKAESPDAVLKRIESLIAGIQKRCPKCQILVLSVLPNGENPDARLRKDIVVLNEKLKDRCKVKTWGMLDVHDLFFDSKTKKWKRGLTIDGTHLSAHGYDLLARKLRPAILEILERK